MTRTSKVCVGARYHSPIYYEIDNHHLFPKFLCALLGVPERRETVPLCATDHDNVHHALTALINTGTVGGHRLAPGSRLLVEAAWVWWRTTLEQQ